jgi:hypothetical protein
MRNDCLVTKLKGVVDNDNLPVFGESYFDFMFKEQATAKSYGVVISVTKPIVLKVEGSYFSNNAQDANYGTSLTIPTTDHPTVYIKKPSSGSVRVSISDKYSLRMFNAINDEGKGGSAIVVNNNTFNYSTELIQFSLNTADNTTAFDVVSAFSKLLRI